MRPRYGDRYRKTQTTQTQSLTLYLSSPFTKLCKSETNFSRVLWQYKLFQKITAAYLCSVRTSVEHFTPIRAESSAPPPPGLLKRLNTP